MIKLAPEARAHLLAFERFYIDKQRPQALRNFQRALAEASAEIGNTPWSGSRAPRPYPALTALGLLWLKRGRYWIAYDPTIPIIAGIFYETDDIPNRVVVTPP